MTAIAIGTGIYTAVMAKKQRDDAADLADTKATALLDLENNLNLLDVPDKSI